MTVNPIDMQKCLSGVHYPAAKKDIVEQAESHGAGKEIMDSLKALPDKQYDSPAAINKEVSKES